MPTPRSGSGPATPALSGCCRENAEPVKIAAGPELVVKAVATLDPRTAIFGRPLDETSWDFTARNDFLGEINQRGLRVEPVPQRATGRSCLHRVPKPRWHFES